MLNLSSVLKLLGLGCFGLFAGASIAQSSEIVLPNPSASAGANIVGQIQFEPQTNTISGVQFDLQYDNSVVGLTATLGGSGTSSGKALYSVDLNANTKRFLIIGFNQTTIPAGALVNLSLNVSANAPAGVYPLTLSNISATDPKGNATPVNGANGTITVTSGVTVSLQPSGVVNAASFLSGPVAPGELITLFGAGIGPASPELPSGSATNVILGGTGVTIGGTAAPLLYAGPNQINAIVPYELTQSTSVQVAITNQRQQIAAATVAVASTAPAIFTLNNTGAGAGAILNQDLTVNSATNPAAAGSAIAIFANGAGATNPAGVDGQITGSVLPVPLLPVTVTVGGVNAKVLYAGAAPDLVAGVLQVNVVVPSGLASGSAVPVVLTIGGVSSPAGVTVALK